MSVKPLLTNEVGQDIARAIRENVASNNKLNMMQGEIDILNNGGLNLKEDFIGGQVNNWLDEHPEATTTVIDGSLTKSKFANGVIPYVTPEMYGAVGDGITDDTDAVQSAFDSGLKVVCCGKYLISNSISIVGKQNVHIDASSSFFIYSGYDYAFSLKAITFSELRFGVIEARNGGCISIKSETSDDWSQYVNIYGIRFTAHTNCIYAKVDTTGSWVTECRIHDMNFGMFEDTESTVGIRMDALRTNTHNGGGIDGWKIQNVGFEGLDTCIKAKNSGFIGVYHCRTSESISHIFDFTDSTYDHSFIMVSNDILIRSWFDLMSKNTYGKVICDRFYNGKRYIRDGFLVNKGDILYNNSFGYINIINSITELAEDCVANILSLNGAARDVKLGVQYGREYGVNSFKLNSWGDVGVKLMDREGNEIFEITSENKGKTYQFNYYSYFGWEHHEIISDQVINSKFKELDEKSTISELKSFSATINANSDSWIKNINNKKIIGIVSDNSNIVPRISFSGNNSQVYAKNNANTDITCNIYYYEFM